MKDRRMRFQVNRVDNSQAPGQTPGPAVPEPRAGLNIQPIPEGDVPEDEVEGDHEDGSSSTSPGRSTSPAMLISSNYASDSNSTAGYDTKYGKSFRHFTREALPRLDNYRHVMSIRAAYRPTLDELHNVTIHDKSEVIPKRTLGGPTRKEGTVKFGWIKGVLVRCLLNIWGVMLFLRLSWVVGQAGIGQAILVIVTATITTFVTALSMSAICTNGQIKGGQAILLIVATTVVTTITAISMSAICTNGLIKGGGTYYMISRSLGPEFGASIGLIFSVANAVAVAMYTVGFAESMNDLLKSQGVKIIDNDINDIRIVGAVAVVILACIVVIGMEWEATAQVILLFILLAAMLDFMIGAFVGPLGDDERGKGFIGFNATLMKENLYSDYRESDGVQNDFFSVFSIFFPAATGILAGANISGDLKDPQAAIPKGTLLAIILTTVSYIIFAIIAGGTVLRDASGNFTMVGNCTEGCNWGLQNSFQVMELVSIVGPIIYAGCFAATLSSALASFVSAPKVFQALCNDKLYPYLEIFGKGYGKNNEPVRAYILTFIIALAFVLVGELNPIAALISNFFLAAYALVNFSTFHASLIKPIGWRPTFKYYNMWLSLLGFVLCVAVMFLISWWTALITFAVIMFLYLIVIYRKPDVNWGSTTQAQTYKSALMSVQQLNHVEDHVKNYRPQILVFSGYPVHRPPLVDFAYLITKNLALLICGQVIKEAVPNRTRHAYIRKANKWLHTHRIKAFYSVVDDTSFEDGTNALLQACGLGKMKPNIVMMGYKADWRTCDSEELLSYFSVIHKAFDRHVALTLLRVKEGLDYSKVYSEEDDVAIAASLSPGGIAANNNLGGSQDTLPRNQSFSQISQASSVESSPPGTPTLERNNHISDSPNPDANTKDSINQLTKKEKKSKDTERVYRGPGGTELPKEVVRNLTQFRQKHKDGAIDVWWLYDDGGLTLLLPFVISTRSSWSHCKLRVFALANKMDELEMEHRSMASLLAKFRIDYSDLKIIPDITKKPQESTKAFFNSLMNEYKENHPDEVDSEVIVTDAELLAHKDKTNRHLRLRELLLEHSKDSTLVVMTLPMPRKGSASAPLYMAWLEVMTRDMPPFLLVRGNQQSVLTFYS